MATSVMSKGNDPTTGESVTQYFNRRNVVLKQNMQSNVRLWNDIAKYLNPRMTRFSTNDKNGTGNKRNT
jgi:hypothetical protein